MVMGLCNKPKMAASSVSPHFEHLMSVDVYQLLWSCVNDYTTAENNIDFVLPSVPQVEYIWVQNIPDMDFSSHWCQITHTVIHYWQQPRDLLEQVNILLMLMSQVLQELGHLACGFMCTCTRGPDGEPVWRVSQKCKSLILIVFFYFCWVICTMFFATLCLCTQWLC